jgi:hypothetical protein
MMPTIKTQKRTGVPELSGNGSLLSQAIPVGEIADDWIRMVIYGANRVGKTHLACQFPKPLLLVAFEPNPTGGAKTVKNVAGVTFLRMANDVDQATGNVTRWASDKGLQLCREIAADCRFATVVVDGATSYQDFVLQEVMGWKDMPEQLSFGMVGKERYQERAEKVKVGLKPFLSLPCHVVVLAKEKDHNPPRDDYSSLSKLQPSSLRLESYFAEDVGGSVAGWLHDACDYIGRLQIEDETRVETAEFKLGDHVQKTETLVRTGRQVRRLKTMYNTGFAAGFRSATPAQVPEFIEDPTFEKIWKVIQGK